MVRGLEHLSSEKIVAVQPGEEQSLGRPYSSLPVSEQAYKKAMEGLLTRACSVRIISNGFKLDKGSFRLDITKKFFTMRVVRPWPRLPREAVVVHLPGSIQGQAGWSSEKLGLVEDVPAHGRGIGTR